MASLASLEGHFYKPRMDRELLQTYGSGLIASTGCPSGEVQTRLRLGQFDEAVRVAGELQDIFGKDYFYVELMDHGLDIETRVTKDLLRVAEAIDAPLVATNDLHYTKKEDHHAHEVLLCVQSGSTLADPKRFKFDAEDFYLKSAAEMRRTWADLPEACDNTLRIAEQCEVEFNTAANYMPRYPTPEGEDETSWFVKEVENGPARALPRPASRTRCASRRCTRPRSSRQMGFPGYFLVVADFINWAKDNGIRVGPGRGSGAGSMAAYAMRHHRPRPAAARADLRAVPQPRPRLDARLRRRLRRASPRRGHPVRHRQVRRGPRRPDRHLRHHQGQAGAQGLLAGPRLPLRDGGEADQGDAAVDHGQGHHPVRASSTRRQAVLRGRGVPPGRRGGPGRRSASSRPRAGWRTSSASGACTRPASSCRASRSSTSSRSCAASRTARSSRSSTTPRARGSG